MKNFLKIILTITICYVFIFIGWLTRDYIIHEISKDGIAVLGYHGVVEDDKKKEKYSDNCYFMSVSEFEKQMKYLYDHDYQCLSMDEVYDYYYHGQSISKKCVCLTFDDGYKNFNTIVKPILEKYNLKATCFVIGYKTTIDNPQYLKQEDLINDEHVEYYSHSYDLHHHASIPYKKLIETLSVEEIAEDFKKNENIVSSDYFAFPYGRTCKNAKEYLKTSSVKLAFGYNQNRTMTRDDDPYLLPRYLMFSNMPMCLFKWYVE